MSLLAKIRRRLDLLDHLDRRLRRVQEALGRIEQRQIAGRPQRTLRDAEFQVYSQWGEDGILQRLLSLVPVARKVFVEFGVEDYAEANTRFLLVNDNWSGLVMDGSAQNIARIRADPVYWRHNLKALQVFVTAENINGVLRDNGLEGEIGLLSVDIDGNDYWVWKAIDAVQPALVVAEYNWRFGAERSVTVPYDPAFDRRRAHESMVYYGASLAALEGLAAEKGLDLVGCNSAGNNAFFVRRGLRPQELPRLSAKEAFVPGRFREARLASGSEAFVSPAEEAQLLAGLPVVEVPAATSR